MAQYARRHKRRRYDRNFMLSGLVRGGGIESPGGSASRPVAEPRVEEPEFQTKSAGEELVHGDQGTGCQEASAGAADG